MRKIFLTAIALLSIASSQVFGSYGVSDWITFLTDGNRFEAKLDQLGFTLGNDTIKGTFGFHNDGRGGFGDMLIPDTTGGNYYNFRPTISMGIGYTSSLIGIGVGYNATIGNKWSRYNNKTEPKQVEAVVHTPVLVLNAMDNAFRMAIPIQVLNLTDKFDTLNASVTAVSVNAQFRYYSGLEVLPQVRLYLKYGNYGYNFKIGDVTEKGKYAESFGFDLRFYFGTMVEDVLVQPLVKLAYNGALGKQHNVRNVTALGALDDAATVANSGAAAYSSLTVPASTYGGNVISTAYNQSAWDLQLMLGLGLTANSDIVSFYFEPELGMKVVQAGNSLATKVKEVYGLGYNVYAEIYITPIKNLEWYFEAEIGDALQTTQSANSLVFNGTTGITWYLPAL